MATTKEILEKTGIKSQRTLTRWYKEGLIPRPKIKKHPSGKGTVAIWPDEVIERCIELMSFRKPGRPFRSASDSLQSFRWIEANSVKLDRLRREDLMLLPRTDMNAAVISSDTVSAEGLPALFVAMLMKSVYRFITKREIHDAIASRFRTQNIMESAIALLRLGFNPILVVEKDSLRVSPDFMISQYLSHSALGDDSFLIVPLLTPLKKAFNIAQVPFPEFKLACPVPKIRMVSGSTSTEMDIAVSADGSFRVLEALKPEGAAPAASEGK